MASGTTYILGSTPSPTYRFYAHSHPYAGELAKRLRNGSIRGLQKTDTEYVTHADGSVRIIPESTRAILLGNTTITLINSGESRTLTKGTYITLLDSTRLQLPSGKKVSAPEALVPKEPQGLRFTADGGAKETVAFGTALMLVNGQDMILPDNTPARIPANTVVELQDCKPLPTLYNGTFFQQEYGPAPSVLKPYPVKDLDFSYDGAYSVYNWELFFHIPFTIAVNLSKNQRFEEAMQWFHLIFDPTDDSDGPTPERFWRVKPFQATDVKLIEETLINLSTGADAELKKATTAAIAAWKDAPFRPHRVARYRHPAYMLKTVMAYLDNLIAWGDSLFREDTGESINEATQFYVMAANILGPRPQVVPKKRTMRTHTYDSLKKDLDAFGNALVELEADLAAGTFASHESQPDNPGSREQFQATLHSIGSALYFCVPRNDRLLGYWDTVADRLFKIHNSLNLLGIFRQLPLFEPPIDPALLARAAAAGVDVAAIVSGLHQPLPLVRFPLLLQKALDIAQEAKALGNSLLSALEKEDGEAIALLRAKHESAMLEKVELVRYAQVQEAIKAREGLLKSLDLAVHRYTFYELQLGREPDKISIPEFAITKEELEKLLTREFKAEEPTMPMRAIEVDIAKSLEESRGKIVSEPERKEFEELRNAASARRLAADLDMTAKLMAMIPEFGAQVQPLGLGAAIQAGGRMLSGILAFAADHHRIRAEDYTYSGSVEAKVGAYDRRAKEWAFQSNLAAGEITQIFKQIRAAEIRQAIADMELDNHRKQRQHADEIIHFLNEQGTEKAGKLTNKAFYAWMKREVKGLYAQCFQFAFEIARKAERSLQHELGKPEASYVQTSYLAGKEGLFAGDKLCMDLKRMEMAWHELNKRDYELTKHASLLQVNPMALVQLRTTGSCTVQLREDLFDMDGPGHYFRRIKSVALSIPCVVGPYASVNCTLTLLKSSIRKVQTLRDGKEYAREEVAGDDRFEDYFGSLQSIVTSSAQNDSGLFETNLRDERYLPFENYGAISEWRLQLPANPTAKPAEPCQFDYNTISDVILHMRYTAREAGEPLRKAAIALLQRRITAAEAAGSIRLFSLRHEFPTEWARFTSTKSSAPPPPTKPLIFDLRPEHFPYWSQGKLSMLRSVVFLSDKAFVFTELPNGRGKKDEATPDTTLGNLAKAELKNLMPEPTPDTVFPFKFALHSNNYTMKDMWMAVTWGTKPT